MRTLWKAVTGAGVALAAAATIAIPATVYTEASAHAETVLFAPCADGHSGIATNVTSCPFAENVRIAYLTQPGPDVIAYSPVTGQAYDMLCSGGYVAHLTIGYTVPSVRCVGGNDAVVVLF